jgi:hypothetical protein
LKNSFQGISPTKVVRKLLKVRSPQTLKLAEITVLVPFSSSATGVYTSLRFCFAFLKVNERKRVYR